MSRSEPIREPGQKPRLPPVPGQPLAITGMPMARGPSRAVVGTAQWLGDQVTDWTGLAALRVPLERASGPRAVALDLPGYLQTNQFIKEGSPVLVVIRNPGADSRHWVVVYGYRRIPDQVYIANNGLPFFSRNRVSWSAFRKLWEPKGNRLVCSKDRKPVRCR